MSATPTEVAGMPRPTDSAELSIAFSAAELTVLCDLLGLPFAAVGQAGTDGRAAAENRRDATDAARRALRSRGVLGDGDAVVATAVAELLRIVAAPQVAVDVEMIRTGRPRRHRYALSGPAGIERTFDGGRYRFTPFAAVDVLVRVAEATGLLQDAAVTAGRSAAGDADVRREIPAVPIRRDALLAASEHEAADRVAAELTAAGAPAGPVAVVAHLIAQRRATISVRVRRFARPGRVEGGEISWLATPRGPISWPVPASRPDPWEGAGAMVTLRPLPVRALLADLAEAITGTPVAGDR